MAKAARHRLPKRLGTSCQGKGCWWLVTRENGLKLRYFEGSILFELSLLLGNGLKGL